jgi:stress response protein YsnF
MVEEVPVRREVDRDVEGVDVQHVPVGEVVSERRKPWREGETIVVPIYEERLVVERQLVLTEQLRIRRVSRTERQEVQGTIRRERAVIDDPGHYVREQDHEPEKRTASPTANRVRSEDG